LVSIWAKGYRVSITSEEFQLVVPPESGGLQGLEQAVAATTWPAILDDLLRGDDRLLKDEFCLLVNQNQLIAVALASSKDRFRRRSVVAVGAMAACDWSDAQLATHVARTRNLAQRLAQQYGDVLAANAPHVEKQLRSNRFIPERQSQVDGEAIADLSLWTEIVSEIRKWRGVTGIATAGLYRIGANVLYGTTDELERARGSLTVDGLFDSRSRRITPIGDGLTPWSLVKPEEVKAEKKAPVEEQLAALRSEIKDIRTEMRDMRHEGGVLRGLMTQVRDMLGPIYDFVTRKDRKGKHKGY
jgi:hypothetical protein